VLTTGSYSNYSVIGVFQATEDAVIPLLGPRWAGDTKTHLADIAKLSTMLKEVECIEVWGDW